MIIPNLRQFGRSLLQKNYASRSFFQWLVIVANRVDFERLKQFGPDRVCAEWLLRNGATVKWVGVDKYVTNYNALPPEGTGGLHVEKIDATESSISHHGFLHLRNCNHIQEIILNHCGYLENEALKQLSFVTNSLESLEVSKCGNISYEGLLHLRNLKNLKILKLFDLDQVNLKTEVLEELQKNLENCEIISDFDEA